MKELFKYIGIVCVLLLTAGCDSVVPEEFQPEQESHHFSVDNNALVFYAEGTTRAFNIKTTEDWTISGFDYWLSSSAESGQGTASITMTAEQNTSADLARTSIFYVKTNDPEWEYSETMSAEQGAAAPYIDFSQEALHAPGTFGSYRIYVESNTKWRVSVNGGNWCSVVAAEDLSYFDVNITENTYGYSRTMYVTLVGAITRTFEVTQQAASITADNEALHYPRSGGSYLINLSAEASWSTFTAADWIDVSQEEGQSGEYEIVISAAPNWHDKKRTGYLYFNIGDSFYTLTITQDNAYIYSINEYTLRALGDEFVYFEVSANFPWEVISAPSWLEASYVSSGDLEGTLMVKAENNSESVSRSGIITIGLEGYSLTHDLLITQPGKYFAVNNEALSIGSRGGTLQVTINTNDIWGITLKNEVDWLTFSTTSGKERKTVDFIVGDNPSVNTRSATVNIAPADVESVDVVVRQEARYLTVDTYGVLLFGKECTSSPIIISTDGEYEVTADVDWLSISQDGDVLYIHATENTSKFIRYGNITIRLTDLIDGEMSLSIAVEQLVRGGNFKKEDFDEDAKWDINYYGSINLEAVGFDDEEDWTDPSYHGLTVSKTGYTEDVNWEGIFNSIVLDKDNYPDDNLMDSTPGTGNIDNDNFNNDSYYDTPPANGSGDIGKDNYGNDGAYDNNIGNVGADKETLPDDDQYDDSAGNGDINKDGYSEDASYDPNNSSDMDKGGYSDDDSYDMPYGTGGFDKGEHPDEDTSYDLDEGEGDINKEDFSDEQDYDNDNI